MARARSVIRHWSFIRISGFWFLVSSFWFLASSFRRLGGDRRADRHAPRAGVSPSPDPPPPHRGALLVVGFVPHDVNRVAGKRAVLHSFLGVFRRFGRDPHIELNLKSPVGLLAAV